MLGTDTSEWISIYKSTPGRRAFAASQVEIAASDHPDVMTAATAVRVHDEGTVKLQRGWLTVRVGAAGSEVSAEAVAADQLADRWVTSTVRSLHETAKLSNARGQAATRLARKHFPDGAEPLTKLPFAESSVALKTILDDLAKDDDAADVAASGIGDHIAELGAAHIALDAAIRKQHPGRLVSYEDVRVADRIGQNLFSDLVVAILWATTAAERRTERAALLRPIDVQNDQLRTMHRNRRRVTDVDPTTGVEDATSGDDAPAEASEDKKEA